MSNTSGSGESSVWEHSQEASACCGTWMHSTQTSHFYSAALTSIDVTSFHPQKCPASIIQSLPLLSSVNRPLIHSQSRSCHPSPTTVSPLQESNRIGLLEGVPMNYALSPHYSCAFADHLQRMLSNPSPSFPPRLIPSLIRGFSSRSSAPGNFLDSIERNCIFLLCVFPRARTKVQMRCLGHKI